MGGVKRRRLWILGIVLLALPLVAMPRMMGGHMMGSGWMRIRMQAMHAIPVEYARLTNPLEPTPERIAEGGRLYQQYCASCHGPEGQGNGPAGKNLDPPPTPLARTLAMPMTTDGYVFWRIQKGGQPFGSAMPAWEQILKEGQIWKIILYMRAGFPAVDRASSKTSLKSEP